MTLSASVKMVPFAESWLSSLLKSSGRLLIFASVVVLLIAAETSSEIQDQCRLWLAPSSVSSSEEHRKLGLFAGIHYDVDDIVGQPEIAVPFIDFVEEWNIRNELDEAIISFMEGFFWTADYAGAKWESDHSTVVLIPGHGVLANYHSGDYNVDWSQASALLRTAPETPAPGIAHPSRGAITPYFNLTITATQPIKPGMEIFANFGNVWDGNSTDIYQDRLTRSDYKEADKVIEAVIDFMDNYKSDMTPELEDEILEFITKTVLGTAAGQRAKAIRSLIPSHPRKLQAVVDAGGSFQYRNPDLVKSKKWLRKHGTCVDNIKSGPSTIPEAGRGAFATRKLPKGTVIAPMPMIQVPELGLFSIHEYDEQNDTFKIDEPPIEQQLAMNYAFAHPESNMLLLPVGSMVCLINHQRGDKANAKVQWSENKHWGNKNWWLDMDPSELLDKDVRYIGIVMEIVATRDIKEGEEVFIDYGDEWQEAWDEYMAEWEDRYKTNPKWPLKADDMNQEYRSKPFKTMEELKGQPYPAGIQTACFVEWEDVKDGRPRVTPKGKDIASWVAPKEFKDYSGTKMFDCEVIERSNKLDNGLWNYTISGEIQVENVPHATIVFVDAPYMSDIHHPRAFRHPIGIPDEIFPQPWRDARADEEYEDDDEENPQE